MFFFSESNIESVQGMSFMAISNPYLSLVSVEDIQRNPCIFSNDKTSFLLARMDTIAQDDGTAIAIRTYPVGTSSISSVFLNHYQIYFDNNRFMVMSGVSDVFRLTQHSSLIQYRKRCSVQ